MRIDAVLIGDVPFDAFLIEPVIDNTNGFVGLIGINPDLDPFFIPKGTLVKVFVTDALLNGASSAA